MKMVTDLFYVENPIFESAICLRIRHRICQSQWRSRLFNKNQYGVVRLVLFKPYLA